MPNRDRRRKISLQNDYAYCIIEPVSSPIMVPVRDSVSFSSSRPRIQLLEEPEPQDHDSHDIDVEVGEDAYLSLERQAHLSESFRRWSFSNYQRSGIPTVATVSEITAMDFVPESNGYGFKLLGPEWKEGTSSGQSSKSSSTSSLNWVTGMISNIPERIRKLSSDRKKPLDIKDQDLRKQMKNLVVY